MKYKIIRKILDDSEIRQEFWGELACIIHEVGQGDCYNVRCEKYCGRGVPCEYSIREAIIDILNEDNFEEITDD